MPDEETGEEAPLLAVSPVGVELLQLNRKRSNSKINPQTHSFFEVLTIPPSYVSYRFISISEIAGQKQEAIRQNYFALVLCNFSFLGKS
ncbi:MAG: hypothetical protein JNM09_04730 [Blastocatellia bacterium]|nr:hypothetical protein [Blastocatellia bacterium]